MTAPRLLIVDDNQILRLAVKEILERLGYQVVGEAVSAQEAIAQADRLLPDLVLMDIFLNEEGDGIHAAEEIMKQFEIPVVFLSGLLDDRTVQAAKQTGAYGYLVQPIDEATLKVTLETALQRVRLDRQLRQGQQWLLALISSMGDGVIATDPQGRIVLLNAGAENATGWTQADALGRDYREVFVLEGGEEEIPDPIRLALNSRGMTVGLISALPQRSRELSRPSACTLLRRNGSRILVDGSATPIRGPQTLRGQRASFQGLTRTSEEFIGAVLLFKDVSERERLAEMLLQMLKMEAVGRLAGGIAHDFNNLLTIINGLAELLISNDPQEVRQFGRDILQAGERAATLTRQLLAFAGKGTYTQKVVDLNVLVRDLKPQLSAVLSTSVALLIEECPTAVSVEADPALLARVLLTLASNASDAMPDGGQFRIQVDRAVPTRPPGTASGNLAVPADRPWPRLRVSDTGKGMGNETCEHLFEPYFGAGEQMPAGGLALAAVYGIIGQHHGSIEVESQLGGGTTFTIFLPPVGQPESSQPPLPQWSQQERSEKTILLVDDEAMVRTLTRTVLQNAGYTVLEAGSGEEGIRVADAHQGPIDLLVTDVVMPVINGRVLYDRLSLRRPDLRVLYISGYTYGALENMGLLPQGIELLHKPFGLAQFRQRVADLIGCP